MTPQSHLRRHGSWSAFRNPNGYVDLSREYTGVWSRPSRVCEHCDGERSPMCREDSLRGEICPVCDSSLDEMFGVSR